MMAIWKDSSVSIRTLCWILLIAIVLICILPLLLTQFSIVDFTDTGEIGDTIGGIMGPFVAIIASFLTFLAFLMQYQANEVQKSELKRQSVLHDREQFESKLYQMLDVYNQNVTRLRAGDLEGKRAIPELLSEFHYIYRCVRYAYIGIKESDITSLVTDKAQREDMLLYMNDVIKDAGAENLVLMKFAYSLFFYGFPRVDPYEKYKGKYVLENIIYQSLLRIPFEKADVRYQDYFLEDKFKVLRYPLKCSAHYEMMKGHNEELGIYYRQMFQFFMAISDVDKVIADEDQKYRYAKLLRSQLTDSEQVLLYYNSMSEMGTEWNRKSRFQDNLRESMGLIARFRLIKNIPGNYPFFGLTPDIVYQNDIRVWRDRYSKDFFEHPSFMKEGLYNYSY